MEPTESEAYERETLKAFVESEGYKLFLRLIEAEWGADATMAKIEKALDAGGDEGTVQQIRVARREVQKAMNLPYQRLRQVAPPRLPERMFGALRRVNR